MAVRKAEINLTYVVVALILGLAVLGFGWMNIQYKEKSAQKQTEQMEIRQVQVNYCLTSVEKLYHSHWTTSCRNEGLSEGCTLPISVAEAIEEARRDNREDCFKRYPSN